MLSQAHTGIEGPHTPCGMRSRWRTKNTRIHLAQWQRWHTSCRRKIAWNKCAIAVAYPYRYPNTDTDRMTPAARGTHLSASFQKQCSIINAGEHSIQMKVKWDAAHPSHQSPYFRMAKMSRLKRIKCSISRVAHKLWEWLWKWSWMRMLFWHNRLCECETMTVFRRPRSEDRRRRKCNISQFVFTLQSKWSQKSISLRSRA